MLFRLADFPPSLWNNIGTGSDHTPTSLQDIVQLVVNLIQIALSLAGVIAVIFIVVGAIRYMAAGGSPDGVKGAKKTLSSAVVGLVIVILAYTVVGYIVNVF